MSDKKGNKKSSKTQIDEETGVMSGVRKIMKTGNKNSRGGYYVYIPWEFVEKHNLKKGDPLPFVSNHVLKFVPVKEE